MSVSLSDYKPQVIGGIIKKYLRELENSLIPTEYYDRFIAAASKSLCFNSNLSLLLLLLKGKYFSSLFLWI